MRTCKRRVRAPTSFRAATLTAKTLQLVVARHPCRAGGLWLRDLLWLRGLLWLTRRVVAGAAGCAWLHALLRSRAVFRVISRLSRLPLPRAISGARSAPARSSTPLGYIDLQWFAAADDEGRTEEPSEHKKQKAREEGRVAKSQELSGALVMLFPVIVLIILAPYIFRNCIDLMRFYFLRCTTAEFMDTSVIYGFFYYFLRIVVPLCATAVVSAIAANVIQTRGLIFSTKPIEFNFSKVAPKFGQYLKKTIFSPEGAFNVAKSILKVILIFIIAYAIIKSDIEQLVSLLNVSLWTGITHISGMTAKLLVICALFFLVISIPDYLVQRYQFMQTLKMTKQEVKEEYKQMEGDPRVKARLRQYMQELLRQSMPASVAAADVVITNPTHFAVAIQYDQTKMQGPMVTAKGQDELAQRIKAIARENEVPIVENKPLARALYAEVDIGEIIPENYYQALAVILANVYNMRGAGAKA
ncbi:MAG: flagellar biosynthesis protein FlhB [Treponemataceae bacterium]|nr:MAG: flagellar biosynthesis protein FlhB [Treponemataceae bacterium]